MQFHGGDNVNSINILCDGYYDCHSATFYLGSAQTVNIIFNGLSNYIDAYPPKIAGGNYRIYAQNVTDYVNITCIGYDSCDVNYVWCPYSEDTNCRIYCYGEGSCPRSKYHIVNSDYNGLEIDCILPSELVSSDNCFRWQIGQPWGSDSDIECIEEGLSTDIVYNKYQNKEVSCDSSTCCPFPFDEIKCTESECIIDCTIQSCDGHIINSYNEDLQFQASSLKIICSPNNVNSTCNGLTILCPDGECILYCNIKSGCQDIIIREGTDSQIRLSCDQRFGCENILMYAENALSVFINATHFCMFRILYMFIICFCCFLVCIPWFKYLK